VFESEEVNIEILNHKTDSSCMHICARRHKCPKQKPPIFYLKCVLNALNWFGFTVWDLDSHFLLHAYLTYILRKTFDILHSS